MQIIVRDNNVDQALRALKKKLQREGVYREMKLRRHYEKPSEKRARERAALQLTGATAPGNKPNDRGLPPDGRTGRGGASMRSVAGPHCRESVLRLQDCRSG